MGRYSSPQDKLLNKLLDKPLELGELYPQDKLWRVEKVSSADNPKGGEGKFWDGTSMQCKVLKVILRTWGTC
jgi:hypothetical protein